MAEFGQFSAEDIAMFLPTRFNQQRVEEVMMRTAVAVPLRGVVLARASTLPVPPVRALEPASIAPIFIPVPQPIPQPVPQPVAPVMCDGTTQWSRQGSQESDEGSHGMGVVEDVARALARLGVDEAQAQGGSQDSYEVVLKHVAVAHRAVMGYQAHGRELAVQQSMREQMHQSPLPAPAPISPPPVYVPVPPPAPVDFSTGWSSPDTSQSLSELDYSQSSQSQSSQESVGGINPDIVALLQEIQTDQKAMSRLLRKR